MLSLSEQATLNFYQWEYQGRGYYLFGTPVHIEPRYLPFHHANLSHDEYIDDGEIPSLFNQIVSIFDTPKQKKQTKEVIIEANFLSVDEVPNLCGISVSFPKGYDISSAITTEFLNMLSFSEHNISFEIIGTYDSISIQIVSSINDMVRIESQLKAYFPLVILKPIDTNNLGFDDTQTIAICDFGLQNEFVRPIQISQSFSIDPLTSIIASLDTLKTNDVVVFQIIFKGVTAPWSHDIPYAVSDGSGGSFFSDSPEMVSCAKEKVSQPLFSAVMRIASQGADDHRSQYLASEFARNISSVSRSNFNSLIPISNEGYDYDFHKYNLLDRISNRFGMILNSKELSTFVHYPNKTVVSSKLGIQGGMTKRVPQEYINGKYILGVNHHHGESNIVGLNDQARLRHTHIIGSTGVGKSTLIANMMIEDMKHGNGCCLFDPHGDIIEDILLRVPEHRKDDVILIDPSNFDFPIGFNLLHATTEAEKMVLSSDLVSAFKRYATSWGDNMSAVLSQAVNTFLESSHGGTLIELKRFLLEDNFRRDFLEHVDDPSIHYYWNNEYQFVRKGIAPLLTRIDTFLRPKIIRYMFAQKQGVDFKACIEQKKIVLIKLSQGLIGEDNSYLLGSLFLSKFNQVAQGRQQLSKEQRHPYYIYLDEFQNFMTKSITSILSGARKYGLGLILAHQELAQIDDPKILNSVISNPYVRICFRLGDRDAKQLENGFSSFEASDLQSLGIGQAIIRIGSSQHDCNLATERLSETSDISNIIRQSIIEHSQKTYGKPRKEIDELLERLLPKKGSNHKDKVVTKTQKEEVKEGSQPQVTKEQTTVIKDDENDRNDITRTSISEAEKKKLIEDEEVSMRNRDHSYLQNLIKKIGQERNFISTIEKETKEGGRIDITLEKGAVRIAFEISITNTPQYEVKNIKKCLNNGYLPVVMISKNKHHLDKIEALAKQKLSVKDFSHVLFIQPDRIAEVLDGIDVNTQPRQEVIKGFRITTEVNAAPSTDGKSIREQIVKLLSKKK
ncbi:ATP-binding protein [Kordia sp. YSTF-M3]|uniref:ATP-binding protein n=1 Tax=Kordia aestuariivivens TaxID=2759037 RepID=A0ABR7QG55_9FLAO|nr:type IV secretion system DNA-binding domain-containing protein [Kordia aestuariivivens]MBC8757279.1 ATP-binding protein [Kordia aestuariivivens]